MFVYWRANCLHLLTLSLHRSITSSVKFRSSHQFLHDNPWHFLSFCLWPSHLWRLLAVAAVAASWSGLSTRPQGTAMVRYHHAYISIYIYLHTHCTYVYIIYRHTYHYYGQLQRLSDSVDARHRSPLPTVKLPWSGWPGYAPARLNHLPVGQVRVINNLLGKIN